jgi:hypothetical protein
MAPYMSDGDTGTSEYRLWGTSCQASIWDSSVVCFGDDDDVTELETAREWAVLPAATKGGKLVVGVEHRELVLAIL